MIDTDALLTTIIVNHPFFAPVAAATEIVFDDAYGEAATDGRRVFLSPRFLALASPGEALFVLLHEYSHILLRHLDRMPSDGDPTLWNLAADHRVNLDLEDYLRIPAPPGAPADRSFADMTEEEIYDELVRRGRPATEYRDLLAGLTEPGPVGHLLAQGLELARGGNVPGFAGRRVPEHPRHTELDWRDLLVSLLEEYRDDEPDPLVPSRRAWTTGTWSPRPYRRGTCTGAIAVAIDTSASVGSELLSRFLGELATLLSTDDIDVHLASFDTDVYPLTWNPHLPAELPGGGGTSFTVVFEWIRQLGTDLRAVVVFTDGRPHEEDWARSHADATGVPILFCLPDGAPHAPFGHVVRFRRASSRGHGRVSACAPELVTRGSRASVRRVPSGRTPEGVAP